MTLHFKYTDYKIIYKDKHIEKLKHINDSNRAIEIYYYESGQIQKETWWLNNNWHREDGPAIIDYYESGLIEQERWFLNDKWYREDGPAYIEYGQFGNIINQKFFLNNIEYTYTDFIQTPEYQAYLKRQSTTIFD